MIASAKTTPSITASRVLGHGDRIRVLVVDDSVVIRRTISMALEAEPQIEVVGVASNGELALQKVDQLNPDVMTLDVEMPGMNGLDVLSEIRKRRPSLRVIMLSTLTEAGAKTTLEALSRGADDCIAKSGGGGSIEENVRILREQLVSKIKQFFRSSTPAWSGSRAQKPADRPAVAETVSGVVLGVSTGGPTALAELFQHLKTGMQLPLLIVQHMPPMFTNLLAQRLNSAGKIQVAEAVDGAVLERGKAWVAPGDFHMRIESRGGVDVLALDQAPPENCCRPSVDVLFRSAAEVWRNETAVVVMTGMGQDGFAGARSLWAAGAPVIVQDEASSVVWGMPGVIADAGIADHVLPIQEIARMLNEFDNRYRK